MKSKRGKSFYPEVVIPGHAIDYVISRDSSDVFICSIFSAQSISAQNNNFSTFFHFQQSPFIYNQKHERPLPTAMMIKKNITQLTAQQFAFTIESSNWYRIDQKLKCDFVFNLQIQLPLFKAMRKQARKVYIRNPIQLLLATICNPQQSRSIRLINFRNLKARPICIVQCAMRGERIRNLFQFLALLASSFQTHMHTVWCNRKLIVKFWVFVISWLNDLCVSPRKIIVITASTYQNSPKRVIHYVAISSCGVR